MSVRIYGAGTSDFGRQPEERATTLGWAAVTEALADAEVSDVDAVYVGSVFGEMGVAQRVLSPLGLTRVPIVRIENACASGTTAFHEGVSAVESGRYGRVLVLGIEHMTRTIRGPIPTEPRDPDSRSGLILPALYAMSATRYREVHGLTNEEMAAVAVKNRGNATLNPRARLGARVTVDEVLGSRMVAEPLTLLQCSPVSDGAAAVVIGPDRKRARDVRVLGTAFASGARWGAGSPSVWGFELVQRVAAAAYRDAGIGPDDVDLVECHDAFTIGEIVTLEALGFAKEGEGGRLGASGETAIGGKKPVNPSGGLLGRGHPLGATGVAQLAEVVVQLRGEAGARQVQGARIGLVETMGGGVAGIDGNGCVVVVLGRSS
jgi:acetyl-CoA C-acetyltransferase